MIYFPLNQSLSSSIVSRVPLASVSNARKSSIIFFLGVELFNSRIACVKSKIVKLLTRMSLASVLMSEFIRSPILMPNFLNYPIIFTESPLESFAELSPLMGLAEAIYFLGYFFISLRLPSPPNGNIAKQRAKLRMVITRMRKG